MKRHGNLFKKIVTFENLLLAAKKAGRGKKGKRPVASFLFNLENEIIQLKSELETGGYVPRNYTLFEVREPKPRKICSSDFRDRVVHHAICNLIEPIFERQSVYDSYACRVGKGAHLAVKRCQLYTQRFKYFLKCDIKKFFESIDHDTLKVLLRRLLKDERLHSLLNVIIDHEVPGSSQGKGLPIGNLTSQHFANLYLGKLDHFIKDHLQVKGYVRYMDDFISFSEKKDDLQELLKKIEIFVQQTLKLELKEKATTLAPVAEGVSFLGFRIYPRIIRIRRENLVRMRKKIRMKEKLYLKGEIKEVDLIRSVNSIIGHVTHVNSQFERRRIFEQSLTLA